MKKIEAIIREEKVTDVRTALEKVGVIGMTVVAAKGRGTQKGITLEWRVGEYRVEFLPKAMVVVAVEDGEVDGVVNAIMDAAYTGRNGDGKIFVTNIEQVYRVRTRESGGKAI